MREEVLKGLKMQYPASPDLLNFTKHAQPIVDAAYLHMPSSAPPKLYGNHWMKLQKNAILNPSNPYVIVLVLTTTGYSSPD